MCEHTEEIGKEQSPARVQAVIRVQSAEPQDHVSEPQGLEEIDDEEMEELSFIPSAVSEPRCALHMCDNKCSKEGFQVLPNFGNCGRRRMSSAHDQLVQAMLQSGADETR